MSVDGYDTWMHTDGSRGNADIVSSMQRRTDVLELRRGGLPSAVVYGLNGLASATVFLALLPLMPVWGEPGMPTLTLGMLSPAIAVCGVAAVVLAVWGWQRRAPRWIEFRADGFSIPRHHGVFEGTWVSYGDVWALHGWRGWRQPHLVLNVGGRRRHYWGRNAFVDADAPDRFVAHVRAGIGRLCDGEARLARLDRRAASATAAQTGRMWVTLGVAVTLVSVFAMEILLGAPGHRDALVALGANLPSRVAEGELFRLVTANVLHASFWHFASNAWILLGVGWILERLVGSLRFGIAIAGGALLGSLAWTLASSGLVCVGASTATFGALALLFWTIFYFRDELPGNYRSSFWFWGGAALLLVVGERSAAVMEGVEVAHLGHVGGAIGGLLAGLVTVRGAPLADLARTRSPLTNLLGVVLGTIFVGGFAWAAAVLPRGS